MTLDLSDPAISTAYEALLSAEGAGVDWCVTFGFHDGEEADRPRSCRLILGYGGAQNKLALLAKGSGGLEELRGRLVRPLLSFQLMRT